MSTFGRLYRVTTAGESHCRAVTVIIEGVPPGIPLVEKTIQPFVDRRRPGQSSLVTPRCEDDLVEILSGTENGITLGTPLFILVKNKDMRPDDYSGTCANASASSPRPSHADYTYVMKYNGHVASSGGGRASARETLCRVIAGAVAEQVLAKLAPGLRVVSFVSKVGKLSLSQVVASGRCVDDKCLGRKLVSLEEVNGNDVVLWLGDLQSTAIDQFQTRTPCSELDSMCREEITAVKNRGDSVGGIVSTVIINSPVGLGEPVFDKFEAVLAHAMLSIPASKGFAFGSGFRCAEMNGSVHNDPFTVLSNSATSATTVASTAFSSPMCLLTTVTNFSGGVQGGITNGNAVYFDVAFKPPATIQQAQETARFDGSSGVLEGKGRHDPCVVPRAVPIVEAMTYMVLLDMLLLQRQRQ